jgi:uncharacterized membrane protein YebE (DUF533 family)
MDVEHLIGTMIQGALLGGGKRSHGASRYLRGGRNSLLNASTLLTVGGLVWGVIETMQQQQGAPAGPGAAPVPGGPVAPGSGLPAASIPPLPGGATPGTAATTPAQDVEAGIPEGAVKLVRLMVAAARADGDLTEAERATILDHARAAGAEALVADEIARPTPLARIVEGIADARQRTDLYTLAFGIVRADETVSGAEQIFMAQLGALLDLEPETVARLEGEAGTRIDSAAAEQR